jgi:hypothetical protein
MNCEQARTGLPDLLYGHLKPEMAGELRQHLAECPACQNELATLQRLQRLLDDAPATKVQVDLPRLYVQAAERAQRRLKRWRRAALALVGTAAALLLVFVLKLEIRVQANQLVVRWNATPEVEVPAPAPSVAAKVGPAGSSISPEDLQLLKDLIHALAADVESRDGRQQQALARLANQLDALQTRSQQRWTSTDRDVTALYTAFFKPRSQGDNP